MLINRFGQLFRVAFSLMAAASPFISDVVAQGFYNASTVYIGSTNVYIDGELDNTGTFQNDGLVAFTGNWNNAGQYDGAGTVQAYSNAPQKIAHNGQNIFRLSIQGWGTKYIKGSVNITGEFDLNEGIVAVSSQDVLKLTRDAVVKGGSPASFVDGPLTTEGNGYKFFPIGKNGTYAPIEFLDVFGTSAEYSMEVFENAPAVSMDDVIVKHALYWQRKDIAGEFGSSAIGLTFEPSHFTNPEAVVLVGGSNWDTRFNAIRHVAHTEGPNKIISQVQVSSPIIMLGETYEQWAEADLYLSTALAPNASRFENRKVLIFGDRLSGQGFHFQVFNRWGDLVYETDSLNDMVSNGWDGRSLQGRELSTGTYPYRLTAVDKTGRPFEKKGVITIVH